MSSGIHSTISSLYTRLQLRWVPKWYRAFSDPQGGFYERLGKGFQPVPGVNKRLVTQCRQLAIYSDAYATQKNRLYESLKPKFDYILRKYRNAETGLWVFSLDEQGLVADDTCDLYALSFVIFACSHYYRACGDERAKETAMDVLTLIETRFRMPGLPGYAEALDKNGQPLLRVRRQNPHMHLLEACLFAHNIWDESCFSTMADEMVGLFQTYFYDEGRNALIEFYTDDLRPHPVEGHRLEPGHYFEWVWLLKKHADMKGVPDLHDHAAWKLFDWANNFGWDNLYGGIYDTVSPDGAMIADTKRIWPFCEALKANALMLTLAPDRQAVKDRVSDMVDVFKGKYMQERGFWTEWLNRNLVPAADYMPGTTPYHVYFGIVETMRTLDRRGRGKSLTGGLQNFYYGVRRTLSEYLKRIKGIS